MYRLDIGIIDGRIQADCLQGFQNSYGSNTLFYRVIRDRDNFESEKISKNLELPEWKETFTFTLNREDEIISFEIYRNNSIEGD